MAGVDGCKAGWIAVHREADAAPSVSVFPSLQVLLAEHRVIERPPNGLGDL
ncbi:MAG: DUF429 domain-containing protein, partial [Mesorhizobium sp.]